MHALAMKTNPPVLLLLVTVGLEDTHFLIENFAYEDIVYALVE